MPNNANTNGMRGGHPTMSGESAEERREKQLQEQKRKAAERERRTAAANARRKAPIDDLLSGKGYTESSELRKKAAARPVAQRGGEKSNKTREMEYEAQIRTIEKALCDKYKISEPREIPNTVENGSSNDDTHLTPIGRCLDDRKNPKLWAIKQLDRTYHTWITGPTGSGKPIRNDVNVLVYKNPHQKQLAWKPIGDIVEGDYICTRNGNPAKVTGVYPHPDEPVWEMELKNGQVIECGGGHLWIVSRKSHGRYREYVETTEQLFEMGILTGNNTSRGSGVGYRNSIPLCSPIEMDATEQRIPPYVLGCLIGDGCILKVRQLKFSSSDLEANDEIERLVPDYELVKSCKDPNDYGYRFVRRRIDKESRLRPHDWMSEELEKLGLLGCRSEGKFIPDAYKNCSIEQRWELLRGLMDTDGTARRGRVSFATISARLRDDVIYIVRSLGMDASYLVDAREDKYARTGGKAYVVQIFASDINCLNMFKLSRKRADYQSYCDGRSDTAVTIYEHNEPVVYDGFDDPSYNPYLYGIALRCTTNQRAITTSKLTPHIKKRLEEEIPSLTFELCSQRDQNENILLIDGCYWNGKRRNVLLEQIKQMNLAKGTRNKSINDDVLHASVKYREAVLQGILDMWGTPLNRSVEIPCKHTGIRNGIIELATSLGYTCTESKEGATGNFIYIKITKKDMFSDPEKIAYAQDVLSSNIGGTRTEHKQSTAIVDIRKTNRTADMTCLMVDDPSASFLIENFTVTHNTTLLSNMIICDMWQHRGGLLIEPAGDLSETILHSAPPYRIHDTVYLDLLDPTYAPGFNPLEMSANTTDAEQRQESVARVTSLMTRHFGLTGEMPRLTKTLQSALNALAFVPGATILEVMDFYTNEDIQRTVLSFMPEGTMKDEISNRAQNIKLDDLGTLENRISRFTNNRYLKQMFGQSHTTLDWFGLMRQGAMIICPIRKGRSADEFFIKFCGSYIVDQIYHAAYQLGDVPEEKRIIFPVILDEFQNYVSGDIETMLSECRKFGISMVLSHQYLQQVKPILGAIMNSCRTKIAYAPSATDAPVLAKSFPGITAQDLLSLPKFHIMSSVQQDKGPLAPFMSAVLPPITNTSPCADDVADLILERTHKLYMKPRAQIDKEINERKELLASGNKEAIVEYARRIARDK